MTFVAICCAAGVRGALVEALTIHLDDASVVMPVLFALRSVSEVLGISSALANAQAKAVIPFLRSPRYRTW